MPPSIFLMTLRTNLRREAFMALRRWHSFSFFMGVGEPGGTIGDDCLIIGNGSLMPLTGVG